MQGMETFIPTEQKIAYINQLLKVGFDTIDFGSFVSPKAIPQLRDTADVLGGLELNNTSSKLLAIVANERGANDAAQFNEITYLGYPFSISETFQQRNTNASIEESMQRVEAIQETCAKHGKHLLIYISMAFGNPYGDPWSGELAATWIDRLRSKLDIQHFALADTVGMSDEANIKELFSTVIPSFPELSVAAHLHTHPNDASKKVLAAYAAGCRSFDAAIKGYGGCPMAEDDLVGNLATEQLIETLKEEEDLRIDEEAFATAMTLAGHTFPV
jgi:hydroxymethylglutaryl-CoA lyase